MTIHQPDHGANLRHPGLEAVTLGDGAPCLNQRVATPQEVHAALDVLARMHMDVAPVVHHLRALGGDVIRHLPHGGGCHHAEVVDRLAGAYIDVAAAE